MQNLHGKWYVVYVITPDFVVQIYYLDSTLGNETELSIIIIVKLLK